MDSKATSPDLSELVYSEYIPDNPAFTVAQESERGAYLWLNLPTGAIVGIVMIPILVITALPILRRLSCDMFYFMHITLASLAMILLCLHASTNVYCLLPGLFLWVGDWAWRVSHSLYQQLNIRVSHAGGGWYRIVVPCKMTGMVEEVDAERMSPVSSSPPLQHYYINIGQISKIQGHPFTVAAINAQKDERVFLFRRSPERKKEKARNKEWTWQLAALADDCQLEKELSLPVSILHHHIIKLTNFEHEGSN